MCDAKKEKDKTKLQAKLLDACKRRSASEIVRSDKAALLRFFSFLLRRVKFNDVTNRAEGAEDAHG